LSIPPPRSRPHTEQGSMPEIQQSRRITSVLAPWRDAVDRASLTSYHSYTPNHRPCIRPSWQVGQTDGSALGKIGPDQISSSWLQQAEMPRVSSLVVTACGRSCRAAHQPLETMPRSKGGADHDAPRPCSLRQRFATRIVAMQVSHQMSRQGGLDRRLGPVSPSRSRPPTTSGSWRIKPARAV